MKVGIIGVQGDVEEHLEMARLSMRNLGISGEAVAVRRPQTLSDVGALIIPGGESTTISKLMVKFDLFDTVVALGREGLPIMGTCAGCVLLASEGDDEVEKTGTRLLGLMDMAVDRNAFGRQRESFEAMLDIEGLDSPYPGVFIRAPVITRTWGRSRPLCRFNGKIVMAAQDNLMALSFHPELTDDTRVYEMFLERA